jgi:hypothetical protein
MIFVSIHTTIDMAVKVLIRRCENPDLIPATSRRNCRSLRREWVDTLFVRAIVADGQSDEGDAAA